MASCVTEKKSQILNHKFQTTAGRPAEILNSKFQIINKSQIPSSKYKQMRFKQSAKRDSEVLIVEFQTLNLFVIRNL